MKKIFLLAIMAVMSLASQAQIVSSRSSMVTKEEAPKNGWTTFSIDYMPGSFGFDKSYGVLNSSVKKSQTFNAYGATLTRVNPLTAELPLFIEIGIGAQYLTYSDDFSIRGNKYEVSGNMTSVKVPLNLIFSYTIPNTEISIDPFVGLKARFNILGNAKLEYPSKDKTFNVFDKDDMEDCYYGTVDDTDDCVWSRFQLGWQIGVKARFAKSFFVGASYGSDFGELVKYAGFMDSDKKDVVLAEKLKISEATLSLGFIF